MFVDMSVDWIPSDGTAKSKYMYIFYFTEDVRLFSRQMVLIYFLLNWLQRTVFYFLLNWLQGTVFSHLHQQPVSSNLLFFNNLSKRQKVESHFDLCKDSFHFLHYFIFFLQLASTLMKITYNNFRDLNMLAFFESM